MIAHHIILFVLLVALPYVWVDYQYLRPKRTLPFWKRQLWWIPCFVMLFYTARMAHVPDFIPRHRPLTDTYLLLLGVLVIPVAVFSLCTATGWLLARLRKPRHPYGRVIGITAAAVCLIAFLYGFTFGFNRVEVKHVQLSFHNLPTALNGYKIVHVSDLHVGTYSGWRRPVLKQIIDSINAQKPDLIAFTGDLQNTRPEEVEQVKDLLSQLTNVYSVLGNHDHGEYTSGTEEEKQAMEEKMIRLQKELGWTLLINETYSLNLQPSNLSHQPATFDMIGTDNDGTPPFPSLADYRRACQNTAGDRTFTIMLQHDPSAWRRHILPETTAQLTLSGHTHGGQMGVGRLRPTRFRYSEDSGLYQEGDRYLHVSNGAGALVPFRLGISNEITVIHLTNR